MNPEALLRANLEVIDRVVREICRGTRMQPDEVQDFASSVMVSLIENDYAVLRRWEGRSSLAGYLSVVIRRLLSDRRDHELGRWQPSAEAARGGAAGVLLEKLVVRDGRSFDEALPLVWQVDPSRTRDDLLAMAARFPQRRPSLRAVDLEAVAEVALPERDRADDRVLSEEARRLSRRASEIVRATIAQWSDEDAMILRFRFGSSMPVADISRMLRIPQRPLYRRIEALLDCLRHALVAAGIDATLLPSIVGEASYEMDFGLHTGEPCVAAGEERP
jgi:RNA polymerase sigma factor for flagellar operon FliA